MSGRSGYLDSDPAYQGYLRESAKEAAMLRRMAEREREAEREKATELAEWRAAMGDVATYPERYTGLLPCLAKTLMSLPPSDLRELVNLLSGFDEYSYSARLGKRLWPFIQALISLGAQDVYREMVAKSAALEG